MISIERDSSGRVYQVWKQNQQNSCGIASCWMARSIALQMSFAEEEWAYAVRAFGIAVNGALSGLNANAPMSLDPRAYSTDDGGLASGMASYGFYGAQLATALGADGLFVEHQGNNGSGRTVNHSKISVTRPAIILVQWNGGGGHFVVVGRCTARTVSYLDPWDGHVNEQYNNGNYVAPYGGTGVITEVLYIRA